MDDIKYANITVFILFFGIALIEALQKQNWLEAGLFMALGLLSLSADFSKPKRQDNPSLRAMKSVYLKSAFGCALGGTLFAGYLSFYKYFTKTCALGESCPYFLGYPACWYGFGMFGTMFVVTTLGIMGKLASHTVAKANAVVSFLGILFAGSFTWREVASWIGGAAPRYTLGLPTCAYGLIFYVVIFALSLLVLRKRSATPTVPPKVG